MPKLEDLGERKQKIMTREEIIKLTKKMCSGINKIALGLYFLTLSPAILAILCTHRNYSMDINNALGAIWIIVCIMSALPLLVHGIIAIFKYINGTKENIYVSKIAVEYIEGWKHKTTKNMISMLILGVILCIFSVLPIITITTLRPSNNLYIAFSYGLIFVIAGCGISILFKVVLRFILTFRLKVIVSEHCEDEDIPLKTSKKKVIQIIIAIGLVVLMVLIMSKGTWYVQPYISTIPSVEHRDLKVSYDDKTGVYSILNEKNTDFKILQLTDIHLGGSVISYSKDLKALETVYDLIESTHPDMVIVTGDFVFPLGIESFSFNNYTPIMQFSSFMRNIGIPWAFTYGNHDTEFVASHSEQELNELFKAFSYETTGSLLYSGQSTGTSGRSNQVIIINNNDGTVNQVLYLIDSNSYTSKKINDYDFIHDDQVKWYETSLKKISSENGKLVSSLIFTHIPLTEYKAAYDLYKSGSQDVKYYYGKIGEKDESICCSNHKSKLFDTAVKIGSTKGIFVGHDHYNNISLGYKGIRLTYGMSIDYLAMPGISKKTQQRGATLITLHSDSTIDSQMVPYENIVK